MAGGGGQKKRFQYCADSSGTILYLRALQGHSGRNLIDPSLQDNVIIPDGFFKYTFDHVGCAINLHSIINSRIDTGRTKFEQQTDSILSVLWILWTKNTRILTRSTWKHHVLHWYMHTKHGRRHQDTAYWVDINLALKERIEVLSDTIERYHSLHEYTPSLLYPESCSDGNWRSHIRKSICVTSAFPKDFFET